MILTCTAANKGDTGKVPEPEIILFQNVEPRNLWSPAVRPYSLQNTPKTDHADIDEGHRHSHYDMPSIRLSGRSRAAERGHKR